MSMISGAELQKLLSSTSERVRIFEVEFPPNLQKHLSEAKTSAQLYEDGHIPGASFLQLERLQEPTAALPHTRPTSASALATLFGHLGLHSTNDRIVLYARRPPHPKAHAGFAMMWATRIWWVLQSWGFDNVSILDGCMHSAWQSELTQGVEEYPARSFEQSSLKDRSSLKAETAEVAAVAATAAKEIGLLDSLPGWPNTGEAYGRAGHIAGAVSADFSGVTDEQTGEFTLKRTGEIRSYFESRFDLSKPLVAY
mmetsp:Transcript_40743/g.79719  ORF Transcript_40743/g.79719 Transcript_40743/m.79719 type:complete len:254 (-) Transcript_40743:493-1254(-)